MNILPAPDLQEGSLAKVKKKISGTFIVQRIEIDRCGKN
jgi:hypothetical protein